MEIRERSPMVGMTSDEFIQAFVTSPLCLDAIKRIREQKIKKTRPVPSATLISNSKLLPTLKQARLLDKIALLTDENYCGRAEMCIQFATLLDRALKYLGFSSRGVMGTAVYYDNVGKKLFQWEHAWVRIGLEVVDGNVDILSENPLVPPEVCVAPYWGPIKGTPRDRKLVEKEGCSFPDGDEDIEQSWWPDLKSYIDSKKFTAGDASSIADGHAGSHIV